MGYDSGIADGLVGKNTYSALEKYQNSAGLPVSNDIDDALLDSLGLGWIRTVDPSDDSA